MPTIVNRFGVWKPLPFIFIAVVILVYFSGVQLKELGLLVKYETGFACGLLATWVTSYFTMIVWGYGVAASKKISDKDKRVAGLTIMLTTLLVSIAATIMN